MSIRDKVSNFLSIFPDSFIVLLDDKKKHEPIVIGNKSKYQNMHNMNKKDYGVFFTPNGHKDGFATENLTKINSWYVDIDNGSKEKQTKLITESPLKPSMMIESKNGFHVYWFAKDATKENFSLIEDRLVDFFNADNNAKKISQLLRVPYFNHNKTYKPFKVKIIKLNKQLIYSENAILEAFKPLKIADSIPIIKNKSTPKEAPLNYKSGLHRELALAYPEVFAKGIRKEDSKRHLEVLSGSHFVHYQTYSFKNKKYGTYQIIVNGKPSSCWIRRDGSIGSYSCGSPSIIQWIRWFDKQ